MQTAVKFQPQQDLMYLLESFHHRNITDKTIAVMFWLQVARGDMRPS